AFASRTGPGSPRTPPESHPPSAGPNPLSGKEVDADGGPLKESDEGGRYWMRSPGLEAVDLRQQRRVGGRRVGRRGSAWQRWKPARSPPAAFWGMGTTDPFQC